MKNSTVHRPSAVEGVEGSTSGAWGERACASGVAEFIGGSEGLVVPGGGGGFDLVGAGDGTEEGVERAGIGECVNGALGCDPVGGEALARGGFCGHGPGAEELGAEEGAGFGARGGGELSACEFGEAGGAHDDGEVDRGDAGVVEPGEEAFAGEDRAEAVEFDLGDEELDGVEGRL